MLIDVNVYLSRWPFRRLAGDEPTDLVKKLRSAGVAQAWAGSFDGLLHKDITSVNARLADECQQFGADLLVPVGTINPMLPDWEHDLRVCHEVHKMPAIRLHPNYHGYTLDSPVFKDLFHQAHHRGLVVQIALKMEDERTQHPLVQVKPVDALPLIELLREHAKAKVVLLNAMRDLREDALRKLVAAGEVFFDISMQEGLGGVSRMIEQVGPDRVLFGSFFPLFHFESAQLKLRESPLSEDQLEAVSHANARRLASRSASRVE